jgi:DNA end-binding protein Ku
MNRAIWRGSISFGLVSIAVRLYPATRHLDVRFRELDRATGQRLRHQRVSDQELPPARLPEEARGVTETPPAAGARIAPRLSETPPGRARDAFEPSAAPEPAGRPVAVDDVVKGFEFEPDRYVTVTATELESLAPERTRTIDVEQFVRAGDVDPIYFDTSYYLVPDPANVRSFAVLLEGMRETGRLGLGWIVLRRKRHLAAIRQRGGLMVLTTMLHADEVLPAAPLEPSLPQELTSREREMARLLIETLSGPFEPERYRDEYRERLLGLLEERASPNRTPVAEVPPMSSPTAIEDLMAALQASVELARQRKKAERAAAPARARRARRGA